MRKNWSNVVAGVPLENHVAAIDNYPQAYRDTIVTMHQGYNTYTKIRAVCYQMWPDYAPPNDRVMREIISRALGKPLNLFRKRMSCEGLPAGSGQRIIHFSAVPEVVAFLDALPPNISVTDVINSILMLYIRRYQFDEQQRLAEEHAPRTVDRFGRLVPVNSSTQID